MNIRIIARTKATVTLSRRDFEALVEELEDAQAVAAYRHAKAQIATEGSDPLPVEMVERLIAGENPVRVWREHRKLTARALAAKAGVNAGYLSMIENNHKPGSVAAMSKLAKALNLTLDDIARPIAGQSPPSRPLTPETQPRRARRRENLVREGEIDDENPEWTSADFKRAKPAPRAAGSPRRSSTAPSAGPSSVKPSPARRA